MSDFDKAIERIEKNIEDKQRELLGFQEALKILKQLKMEEKIEGDIIEKKPKATYEPVKKSSMTVTEGQIFQMFKKHPEETFRVQNFMDKLHCGLSTAQRYVKSLKELGFVVAKGSGYYQYNTTELKIVENDKHRMISAE